MQRFHVSTKQHHMTKKSLITCKQMCKRSNVQVIWTRLIYIAL